MAGKTTHRYEPSRRHTDELEGDSPPVANKRQRRRALAAVLGFALLATLTSARPASAQSNNLCQSSEFSRTYSTGFSNQQALDGWNRYNGVGHAGNGIRSSSAVKVQHGKLVITATNQNGQTVSGGVANRNLSQKYGCYRIRVRTDQDHSNVTSGVVMTWPTYQSKGSGGESDFYETTHNWARRNPFMSFIHRPGDFSSNSQDQHWIRHDADANRYQIMTLVWTPDEMIIRREGPNASGNHTTNQFTIRDANIPHVAHHPTIQLDARNGNRLARPVRLEVDWMEVYSYKG